MPKQLVIASCLLIAYGQASAGAESIDLADGQRVTNFSIIGPDDDLVPPFIATASLTGNDYVEWCLRRNKLEQYLAQQRAVPPRTLYGFADSSSGFSQFFSNGNISGRSRASSFYRNASQGRDVVWNIGGHAGGSVTIYNPFVTAPASRK